MYISHISLMFIHTYIYIYIHIIYMYPLRIVWDDFNNANSESSIEDAGRLRIVDCHHYGWRWFRRCKQTWRKDFISRSLAGNLDVAPNIYTYCLWEMWRTFTFIPNFQQQKHGLYYCCLYIYMYTVYILYLSKDIHIHICKNHATIWSAFLVKDIYPFRKNEARSTGMHPGLRSRNAAATALADTTSRSGNSLGDLIIQEWTWVNCRGA